MKSYGGVVKVSDYMPSDKEMINNLIDLYSILQQIKKENGIQQNTKNKKHFITLYFSNNENCDYL